MGIVTALRRTSMRTKAVIATAIAVAIVPAAVLAWGPSRATFTEQSPAPYRWRHCCSAASTPSSAEVPKPTEATPTPAAPPKRCPDGSVVAQEASVPHSGTDDHSCNECCSDDCYADDKQPRADGRRVGTTDEYRDGRTAEVARV